MSKPMIDIQKTCIFTYIQNKREHDQVNLIKSDCVYIEYIECKKSKVKCVYFLCYSFDQIIFLAIFISKKKST